MTHVAITSNGCHRMKQVARGSVRRAMMVLLVLVCASHSPRSFTDEAPAKGNLFDVVGTPLTVRRPAWGVTLNVKTLRALGWEQAAAFVQGVSTQTGQRPGELQARIEVARRETLRIASGLTDAQMESTRRWLQASPWSQVELLSFYSQSRTQYPLGASTVQLVGIERNEDVGVGDAQEGMLLAMDRELSQGSDVRLSIDARLQRIVWRELVAPVMHLPARDASAVVIELPTANIVALVSLPTWNPNQRDRYEARLQRLRPVTDVFQPGPMLQPFLIAGVLARQLPADAFEQQFIVGRTSTGPEMVRALGIEGTITVLNQWGFAPAATTSSGFPGEAQTIGAKLQAVNGDRREAVVDRYFIDEVGSGRGVAPSLLLYASSFADLIGGTAIYTTSLVSAVTDRQGNHRHPVKTVRSPGFPQVGNELRELLVRRARHMTGDTAADIGGLWSSYDQHQWTSKTRRVACALFAPAKAPRYLVVLSIDAGREATDANMGFGIAQAILQEIQKPAERSKPAR